MTDLEAVPTGGRRSSEHEVEVPGTPEEVWQAIATGPGISAWFAPTQLEPGVGGTATFEMVPGLTSTATVSVWEPGRRLAYVEEWPAEGGGEPVTLATEFGVEARDGVCVVRLVSSFSADGFEEHLDGMDSGWTTALRTLRLYLEHFRGLQPTAGSSARRSGAEVPVAWAAVTSALGVGGPGGTGEGAALADGGDIPVRDAVLERLGTDTALLRSDDALTSVWVYAWEGVTTVSVYQAVFGPDSEAGVARSRQAWDRWLERHVPEGVAAD